MPMKMIAGWALACGLAAFSLMGCSGAEDVSAVPQAAEDSPEAEPTAADARRDGRDGHGPLDAAKFIERFDKDKNGTVELAELPEHKQKWLGKADANKDGRLTADELKSAAEARHREMFQRVDKNSDGALTADEVGEGHWERIRVADADSDSRITMAEMQKAHADGKLFHAFGKGGKHGKGERGHFDPAKMIERFDKDGNGTLEAAELPEHKGKLMERADANRDGKLTVDELKQHAAARHEHKGERKGHDHEAPPAE
jgi:Ca2+-binding EF-hand superfamily protein